ncbi:MAG: hypothetical protein N2482_00305 [Patescibacteria group bacterium]|nr:hypothetical protein [Patescibacteria group bacterium]
MNRKELFLISLTIFLTIFAWVLFDIYRIKTDKNLPDQYNITTIKNVKLEIEVLKKLKTKNQ